MIRQTLHLNPGDRIAEFQVERVESVSEGFATYRVVDRDLGKAYLLQECLPAASASRTPQGRIQPASDSLVADFEQAQAEFRDTSVQLAGLEHPNLERVLRLFEANGTHCCLLGIPAGERLSERLEREGPIEPGTTRRTLDGIAAGLQAMHDHGLLLLSLTPEHVAVSDTDQAVLLDLRQAFRQPVNLSGEIFDTPYLAPELLEGGDKADPVSDVYSFCALAYHVLTGLPPVPATDRLEALRDGQPDPLDAVVSRVDAGSLGGLGDAIDMGLRLNAGERPASLAEWRRALERIDWRRREAVPRPPDDERERPEWLSPLLLGAFLSLMAVAVTYLLIVQKPTGPAKISEPSRETQLRPAADEEETRQWQAALQADTVLGYRRFLASYPESFYQAQANIQLEILDERAWEALSAEDTPSAYRQYLEQFPGGLHEVEALREIERIEDAMAAEERSRAERQRQDHAAWERARDSRSVPGLDAYLEAWPTGLHIEEARKLRKEIRTRELESRAWEAATGLNTGDAYRAYLDAYPAGEFSAEALIRLEYIDLGPGKVFRDCARCPAMRVLPAGEFLQGAADDDPLGVPDEKPPRMVSIGRPFAIGVHEVTFSQWDACVQDGACTHNPPDNGWGRGEQPVIMVSWNDVQEYVGWLSQKTRQTYRLPSESEWEYAARAGELSSWPGGNAEDLCSFGNIAGAETDFRWRLESCSDSRGLGTLPVGSLEANGFGLYDMIGNVAEWTADCMNLSYLDAPTDGGAWNRGICSSHMTRGGSWVTGERESRLPARFNLDNGDRNDFTGFRVVREVENR